MDAIFLLKSLEMVLETVFLCLAIYYIMKGIKTKEYNHAKIFGGVYLLLNLIRNLIGF